MDSFWSNTVDRLTFAFQPIVSLRDGRTIGVEALLRGVQSAGFPEISDVFDRAYAEGCLGEVDAALRMKSLKLFSLFHLDDDVLLFSNLDNRVVGASGWAASGPSDGCRASRRLVLEISERHAFPDPLTDFGGIPLALDDFGTGYSGLQTLFRVKPAFVKIDGIFVRGIDRDPEKQSFFEGMVDLGRRVGCYTIVEGVETRAELDFCLRTGCDAVQGFVLARPTFPGEPLQTASISAQLLFHPQGA